MFWTVSCCAKGLDIYEHTESITLDCISNQNKSKSASSFIPSKKLKRDFWKMGHVQDGISKLRTKNMNGDTN